MENNETQTSEAIPNVQSDGNTTNNINVNVNFQNNDLNTDREVNKVLYVLLCWFVGSFGVHRFLRGQVGIGILYIFTCGGCGIAVLVDFIISLTKLSKHKGDSFEFFESGEWKY